MSVSAMRFVTAYAIPVVNRNPPIGSGMLMKPDAAMGTVRIGTSVPTVGAVALLYSLRNAAAAPTLLALIEYTDPALPLTDVALVVAAVDRVCADGTGAVDVTVPVTAPIVFAPVGSGASRATMLVADDAPIVTTAVPDVHALAVTLANW